MKKIKLLLSFLFSLIFTFLCLKIKNTNDIMVLASAFTEIMIISTIVLNLKTLFKEKKIYIILDLFLLLLLMIVQLIGKNNVMFSSFMLVVFIVLLSAIVENQFKISKSVSVIFAVYSLIILSFIFGLFGLLSIFKYVYCILFLLVSLYFFILCKNEKINMLSVFENKTIFILLFMFIISIVGSYNRYVHVYDEYSLWAHDIKHILKYDYFGNSSYAPILTCWHYIVQMFSNFDESSCYFALSFFININLLCLIDKITLQKWFYPIFLIIANLFYIIGDGVYSFGTLYADLAFAVVFLNCFLYSFEKNEKSRFEKVINYIFYFVMTLIKPQGIIIAFICILFNYLNDICKNLFKKYSLKEFIVKSLWGIKKYLPIGIFSLLIFVGWNFYRNNIFKPISDYYTFSLLPDGLRSDLSLKLNIPFLARFCYAILENISSNIFYGPIKLNLYQFFIAYFICLFIVLKSTYHNIYETIRKLIPFIISYCTFVLLVLLSQFIQLSVHEASILASFARYINPINYVYLVILLILIIKKDFLKENKNIVVIVFIGLYLLIPFKNLTYFVSDYRSRITSNEVAIARKEKFEQVLQYTDEEDKIFVIDQKDQDGIMAMWYARYYLFPRYTNCSAAAIVWKVRTEINKYDLADWGLTYDRFLDHLNEYGFDYLYLYTTDEYLNNYLNNNLQTDIQLKNNSLLKINKQNGTIVFEPIV